MIIIDQPAELLILPCGAPAFSINDAKCRGTANVVNIASSIDMNTINAKATQLLCKIY